MALGVFARALAAAGLAAGLILRRDTADGPRWLLLRATKHGEWGFPKGHQDNGETPLQTAQRECAEECGLALIEIDGPPLEAHYRLNNGKMARIRVDIAANKKAHQVPFPALL